jgi:lysophospholipase L1-like esterase
VNGHVSVVLNNAPGLRRLARATAYGGGGLGVAGAIAAGLLYGQAELARRSIPHADSPPPRPDGRYGTEYDGPDLRVAVLGDSSAAGYGVDRARDTTGALLAAGLVERLQRPVDLHCHALVGAVSASLDHQVTRALTHRPELSIILVGVNDVTHRVRSGVAVGHLARAVARLRDGGSEVVVCTCPDLGTIQPILPPLRWIVRRWSRAMAAAQTVAAVSAGARTVSLGDLLGPQFASAPERMFGADRFHPSAVGYAAAAAAILPTAITAVVGPAAERPRLSPTEGIRSLTRAAVEAVEMPGTEVSPAQVSGTDRGPAGRWAQLRRRVRQFTERPHDPANESSAVPLLEPDPAAVDRTTAEPAHRDPTGSE